MNRDNGFGLQGRSRPLNSAEKRLVALAAFIHKTLRTRASEYFEQAMREAEAEDEDGNGQSL